MTTSGSTAMVRRPGVGAIRMTSMALSLGGATGASGAREAASPALLAGRIPVRIVGDAGAGDRGATYPGVLEH